MVEEGLARVRNISLLASMIQELSDEQASHSIREFHDFLLTAQSPFDKTEIIYLIHQFSNQIKSTDQETPLELKQVLSKIWWDMSKYYSDIGHQLAVHMENPKHPEFREAFLVIPAKKICGTILEKLLTYEKHQSLLQPFKELDQISINDVTNVLDKLIQKSPELNNTEERYLFSLVEKSATYNEVAREGLEQVLKKNPVFPSNLALIIDRLYPNLQVVPNVHSPFWAYENYLFDKCT